MMRCKFYLVLTLVLGVHVAAFAKDGVSECTTPPAVAINGLGRTTCEVLGSVIVERYLGANLSSPYASEFDRRDLTIMHGEDSVEVMKTAGIDNKSSDFSVKSEFIHFPSADQISRTGIARKKFIHHSWSVSTEVIEYGAQGGIPGFQLTCAIALHLDVGKGLVVTECFPMESSFLFVNALDSILR